MDMICCFLMVKKDKTMKLNLTKKQLENLIDKEGNQEVTTGMSPLEKDKRIFRIYSCINGEIGKLPVTTVLGIDEKEAWVNFGVMKFYLNYPENTSFVAKEVLDMSEDAREMLMLYLKGDYTDITNEKI